MTLRTRLLVIASAALLTACGTSDDETAGTSPRVSTTVATNTTATTNTTAATNTAATVATAASTAPARDEPFGLTGTATLPAPAGGADVVMAASDDTLYVALDPDPSVRVSAVDVASGTVRWTATLTDAGGFGWSIGATSLGVLVPYSEDSNPDGDAMKLTLLDETTGQPVWTVDTNWLYEVNNGLNDEVADVWLGEDEPGLLDLSSGEIMAMGEGPWEFGTSDVVTVEGRTVLRGPNPFDPSSMRSVTVDFDVTGVVSVGAVLVVRSGVDLVGLVEGQEVWRRPIPDESWVWSAPGSSLITVEARDDSSGESVLREVLRFDAGDVQSLAGVPEGLSSVGMVTTPAGEVLVCSVVPWEQGSRNSSVLLAGADSLTLLDTSTLAEEPDFQGSVAGLLLDQSDQGIVIRSVPDFAEVVVVPNGSHSTSADDAYFVIAEDEVTVSIYR